MRHCQCRRGCIDEVKGKDKKYARGHHPAGHVMDPKRRLAISEGRKTFFRRGGKSWWEGKQHSDDAKKKMKDYARHRPPEHRDKLVEVNSVKNPVWLKHLAEVTSKRNKTNPPRLGTEQSYKARMKISRTRKKRIAEGLITPWNKGKKGLQVGWAKGLTKETDERVMKISKSLMGHPLYFSRYKCWYPNNDNPKICMRSTWEVAFALWLDSNKIEWQYEPKAFHVGYGKWTGATYTPDFYLLNQGEYVEVKGYMSPSNKRKMDKFYQLYPDVVVHLLNGEHLHAAAIIKRSFGRAVLFNKKAA